MNVNVLVVTGYGLNADKELAWAFELAGGKVDIVHLSDIVENKCMLQDYQILAFPGGFSFGDHISSGKVFANIVKNSIMDEIQKFVDSDKLVIGICNGFQIITILGLVPDYSSDKKQVAALIENESGKFENRWVWVKTGNSQSPWLKDLDELYLPVRHGEGKFIVDSPASLQRLIDDKHIAFQYINPGMDSVEYPFNPNGSVENIAGITNKRGNVLGLMPHPEAYIFTENHPGWTEGTVNKDKTGLELFKNAVKYFS